MLGRSLSCRVGSAVALALFASESGWTAPVPVVDTKSTSTSSGVTREQLENLPVGRRLEDLIRTCPSNTIPTVSRQPDVLIDGKPLVDINCVQPADLDMIEVYKTHNIARAEYGAPPVVWDPLLIQGPYGAQAHVNQLARTGTLFHASRDGRGTVRENIGQGLAGASVGQLLGGWTKEKQNFIPGTFPNVSRTHNWYDIGHWAQMIWIQTVMIGCAKAAGIGTWLVCRYDPGGNKDGKLVGIPPPRQYAVDQPKLPTSEVFGQTTTGRTVQPRLIGGDYTGGATQNANANRASLFDLGIYAGGAWTSDWFGISDVDPVAASTNLDEAAPHIADILFGDAPAAALNHDYGYDGALFVGYDLGAFRLEAEVAYKRADLESYDTNITLPNETPKQAVSNDNGMMGRRASLFDLGIYGGGAYTTDWFEIADDPSGVGVTGGYDVSEAFAEIRIPLLRDNPFFETDLRYADSWSSGLNSGSTIDWGPIEDLLFRGSWAEGFGGQATAGPPAGNEAWLQDSPVLNDYFSLNLGVRADAYDIGFAPPRNYLDFGISRNPFDQILTRDFGFPLTQNGSLNLAYIWLMSDSAATIGGYKDTSTVRVWGADPVGLACKIDEAKIGLDKKLAAGEWIDPAEYEKLYDEAVSEAKAGAEADEKAGGGVDATLYNQNLDKSQALMKTAQDAAAKQSVDTKVQSPELPTQEVFNPAEFKYSCDDVM